MKKKNSQIQDFYSSPWEFFLRIHFCEEKKFTTSDRLNVFFFTNQKNLNNTRFCEELEFTTKNRKIGGNEFSTISCRQKKIYIFMNVSKTQQTRVDFQEMNDIKFNKLCLFLANVIFSQKQAPSRTVFIKLLQRSQYLEGMYYTTKKIRLDKDILEHNPKHPTNESLSSEKVFSLPTSTVPTLKTGLQLLNLQCLRPEN